MKFSPRLWRRISLLRGQSLFLSTLVGIAAGLAAVLFHASLSAVSELVMEYGVGLIPSSVPLADQPYLVPGEAPVLSLHHLSGGPRTWLLIFTIPFGALLSGMLTLRFAPEAEGHGTDAVIEAYHRGDAVIRPRVPLVKMLSSVFCIGFGGSGGREGPVAQIGAGVGSWIGTVLGLTNRQRRILVASGMGAGIGAIFRAPIAGAFFSTEIFYKSNEVESEVLFPTAISSVTAYSIYSAVFGWSPLFDVEAPPYHNPAQLIPYGLLGVACGFLGILYIKFFYGTHRMFKKLPIPPLMKPVIGGFVVGLIGWQMPGAVSTGYGELQKAFSGAFMHVGPENSFLWGTLTLFSLALLRIVTTSFSIGSGGSGGVFGPSMVIGGCFGAGFGQLFNHYLPDLVPYPASFALVGMVSFFAGIAHAPLSTILMVSEMTGDFHLLIPSLWACVGAFVTVGNHTLYEKQLLGRAESRAHRDEYRNLLFETEPVSRWMITGVETLQEDTLLSEAKIQTSSSPHHAFPILNGDGDAVGVFDYLDIRKRKFTSSPPDPQCSIGTLGVPEIPWCTPGDTLLRISHQLALSQSDVILVSESGKSGPLLGIVTRSDLARIHDELSEEFQNATGQRIAEGAESDALRKVE